MHYMCLTEKHNIKKYTGKKIEIPSYGRGQITPPEVPSSGSKRGMWCCPMSHACNMQLHIVLGFTYFRYVLLKIPSLLRLNSGDGFYISRLVIFTLAYGSFHSQTRIFHLSHPENVTYKLRKMSDHTPGSTIFRIGKQAWDVAPLPKLVIIDSQALWYWHSWDGKSIAQALGFRKLQCRAFVLKLTWQSMINWNVFN